MCIMCRHIGAMYIDTHVCLYACIFLIQSIESYRYHVHNERQITATCTRAFQKMLIPGFREQLHRMSL